MGYKVTGKFNYSTSSARSAGSLEEIVSNVNWKVAFRGGGQGVSVVLIWIGWVACCTANEEKC
eukprot:6440827-Amphidinium_carterae.1